MKKLNIELCSISYVYLIMQVFFLFFLFFFFLQVFFLQMSILGFSVPPTPYKANFSSTGIRFFLVDSCSI